MNKKKIIIIIAAVVVLLGGGGAGAYFFFFVPANGEKEIAPVRGYTEPPEDGLEVTDPVVNSKCRKTFRTPSLVYEQKTYYFCCPHCPSKFLADVTKYADKE